MKASGWFGQIRRRLAVLLQRDRFDGELEEEMRAHLELAAGEMQADGMAPAEASYAARRQFGNLMLLREGSRELWGWGPIERIAQDVRYALRTLRHSPGFAAIAILSLALGIGVNTAIFSIVDNLLFRPLRVPEPDRLVELEHRGSGANIYEGMSVPDYVFYREHNKVFAGLAEHAPVSVNIGDGERRISWRGEIVTADYFNMIGISPIRGRWFTPEEDRAAGASPVVVLGYDCWTKRFGGDPDILGREIKMNRHTFRVIGIAPKGFMGLPSGDGPARAAFWVTVAMYREILPRLGDLDLLHSGGTEWLLATGRLKPGISISQAEAALRPLSNQLEDRPARWSPMLIPTSEARIAATARPQMLTLIWVLTGAVALVLLMACVNVAGLLVADRSSGKRRLPFGSRWEPPLVECCSSCWWKA